MLIKREMISFNETKYLRACLNIIDYKIKKFINDLSAKIWVKYDSY